MEVIKVDLIVMNMAIMMKDLSVMVVIKIMILKLTQNLMELTTFVAKPKYIVLDQSWMNKRLSLLPTVLLMTMEIG